MSSLAHACGNACERGSCLSRNASSWPNGTRKGTRCKVSGQRQSQPPSDARVHQDGSLRIRSRRSPQARHGSSPGQGGSRCRQGRSSDGWACRACSRRSPDAAALYGRSQLVNGLPAVNSGIG
jgi:hypothetical protein